MGSTDLQILPYTRERIDDVLHFERCLREEEPGFYMTTIKERIMIMEKAGPEDLDAAAELYGAVCDYLADKPFNPGWRRDGFPCREEAAQYLAADGLYVARDNDKIAGSIALTAEPSAEKDASGACADQVDTLYIHVLAVHPQFLRQGVGSALLDFAAKEAVRRGAIALRLYVWEGNGPAIRAYEKNGYVRLRREDIRLREFGLDWFDLYEKRLDRRL